MITKQVWKIGDSRSLIKEISNDSIGLIITSPPYYNLRDYNVQEQIGYGQSYLEYLSSLDDVWTECYRVLNPNRRMCINVSDIGISNSKEMTSKQPRANFHSIPLHADITKRCIDIGFDYLGLIIWKKVSNCKSQYGGNPKYLGSYPYPPNGHVSSEVEFILQFRKRGQDKKENIIHKKESLLSKQEWSVYFSQIWEFNGEATKEHPAVFPIELPYRLIKMFSFKGDMVFDPFLGRGTTLNACRELERNGLGFEINPEYESVIKKQLMSETPSLETWCSGQGVA